MPLTAGTRLGPYEVVSPLGAGGMGEVYRAKDTRLGRDVAIKVLPAGLSSSPESRARFEREAKTVSSLNHPHICTLFDVGREGDTDFLVMELVDGETLAQRLERGALPTGEALKLGSQIADALDRAHRAGVIHRDLKPGNVMLTKSGAKLMDFGLARATGLTGPSASGATLPMLTQSPTVAAPLTAEGTIVGTFQYMAPEQLEGSEADPRSDLWALGCVLYEMVTGRRAFDGRTQASLISSIMKDEPRSLLELAPVSPPALDRIVRACIAKDPDERLQTAHDVGLQLRWIAEAGSQSGAPAPALARRRPRWLAWGLPAVGVIAALMLTWVALGARKPAPEAIQAFVDPPSGMSLNEYACNVVISPDGRAILMAARDSSFQFSLWVRALGSDAARRLPDTQGALYPFWSPDGRDVAYFDMVGGKLMKVALAGGSPTTICDAKSGRGGSWNRDGTIVFAPASGGPLMRVSAGGGEVVAVTALDSTRNERAHRFPYFLPDGEHFLFAALPGGPNGWDIFVGSLRSRAVTRIMSARSTPVYAEPGYLLFERDGRVMAQKFDTGRLKLEGDPLAVAEAPEPSETDSEPVVSASRNGRLAMLRSTPPNTRLELVDRHGVTVTRHDLPPAPWSVLRCARDGKRAVVLNGGDLWVVDLVRSVPMRFAPTTASDPSAVWSPGGDRIAYVSKAGDREAIHIAGLDGRSDLVSTTDDAFKLVADWSPDGRFIVFEGLNPVTGWDIWLLPLEGDRKPVPYLRCSSQEGGGRISPDGRWLAYASDETGKWEIYVQSFPQPGKKVRVSLDGGGEPFWAHEGRELKYLRGRTVVVVPVEAGEEFNPGRPQTLYTIPEGRTSGDVVGDGDRWLTSIADVARPNDVRLILDWQALLKR